MNKKIMNELLLSLFWISILIYILTLSCIIMSFLYWIDPKLPNEDIDYFSRIFNINLVSGVCSLVIGLVQQYLL